MGIPLLVIVGPTAVGKTEISIELAKRLNGEIISADSMLVYRYMDIGTAKPTIVEQQGIKHYMIDVVEPSEDFSVAKYQKMAKRCIREVYSKGKLPILVGGTGLYVNSIICDMDFKETVTDWGYREKLKKLAEIYGNEYLYKELEKIDKETAAKLHVNDLKRIIRALEIYKFTGKTPSQLQPERTIDKPNEEFDSLIIGLTVRNREELYKRIDKRVDLMIERGLVDEVKKLKEKGFTRALVSMQGLGYKEIMGYLDGEYTLEEAIEKLKRETRRFAKRQLTWFRRNKQIKWFFIDEFANKHDLIENIIKFIEGNLNFE